MVSVRIIRTNPNGIMLNGRECHDGDVVSVTPSLAATLVLTWRQGEYVTAPPVVDHSTHTWVDAPQVQHGDPVAAAPGAPGAPDRPPLVIQAPSAVAEGAAPQDVPADAPPPPAAAPGTPPKKKPGRPKRSPEPTPSHATSQETPPDASD